MELIFKRLQEHGSTENIQKCQIVTYSPDFPEHTSESKGIRLLGSKTVGILNYPELTILKQSSELNGLPRFYRQFVPYRASVMSEFNYVRMEI